MNKFKEKTFYNFHKKLTLIVEKVLLDFQPSLWYNNSGDKNKLTPERF